MSRNNKCIIKTVVCFILISIVLSSVAGLTVNADETSGNCGQNLKWSYSAGTLTISGKGEMQNYNERDLAPWNHLSKSIVSVRLPEAITTIGSFAFYDCTALRAVSIPDSVQKISEKAFYNCTALRLVNLPDNLKFIGRSAFYNCEKLEAVSLPGSLETISDKSFYLCRSITSLVIPENVKSIGKQAFSYCENLLRVEIDAQITEIPEWCFYGCQNLAQIEMPSAVTQIGSYAFKLCDELYTVYHSGEKETVNSIRNQIADDVPSFKNSGYVSSGQIEEKTYIYESEVDENGTLISQTNTSVYTQNGITLVVEVKSSKDKQGNAHCLVYMILVVDNEEDWNYAIVAVRSALSEINDNYSLSHQMDGIKLTLYLKNAGGVNQHFLKELAGRKMTVEVLDKSGSVWVIDCSGLKSDEIKEDSNLSYTVKESDSKTNKELGTNQCYKVNFEESSDIKTNLVITLPASAADSNAFLYQIESFGKHKKLQASRVDGDANARFYVSSINKDTQYIVAINVPNESIDDVIIPDEAADAFGAIFRLEKIKYVKTGERRFLGFTILEMMVILFSLLLLVAIVIGVIMYLNYKKKSQQVYFDKTQKRNI